MAATRTPQQTTRSTSKPKTRQRPSQIPPPEQADVKGNITELLREKGALTRGEITARTGIPRTTVYDTLMNLLISGVVEKYVERNGRRGRPSVYYQLLCAPSSTGGCHDQFPSRAAEFQGGEFGRGCQSVQAGRTCL